MSEKRESGFINMLVTLLVVSMFSGAVLGGVYLLTKDKIAQVAEEKANKALQFVLPDFDNVEERQMEVKGEKLDCSFAYKGDELVGIAVKSFTNKAYAGEFQIMVGLLPSGEINKVRVLKQAETPGLGAKIEGDAFLSQFQGKNPKTYKLQVKKDGGDVDAISAATISSRAFCDAVDKAYQVVLIEDGGQQ